MSSLIVTPGHLNTDTVMSDTVKKGQEKLANRMILIAETLVIMIKKVTYRTPTTVVQ